MKRKRQIRSWALPAVLLVLAVLVASASACGYEETKMTRTPGATQTALPMITATAVRELPDLVVTIEGPLSARPGEALEDRIIVKVVNVGDAAARNFSVGLYFSPDKVVDQRDPLLVGGRELVESLGPGEEIVVPLKGKNTLPENSLPKTGFLGGIVDETQTVVELDEDNNTALWLIRIED